MDKSTFGDLEKIRIEILLEKIQVGIDELKGNPRQQWTPLKLERPLLETLARLLKEEDRK